MSRLQERNRKRVYLGNFNTAAEASAAAEAFRTTYLEEKK